MLKFIIITIVVLYALSFILRILFRTLFFFAGKEITKQMRQQQEERQRGPVMERDGVHIHTKPTKRKDDGEYVDFEEVK